MNAGLHIDQLIRFYESRSHEHYWYVALLHELASDATKDRSHCSTTTLRSHHYQRRVGGDADDAVRIIWPIMRSPVVVTLRSDTIPTRCPRTSTGR